MWLSRTLFLITWRPTPWENKKFHWESLIIGVNVPCWHPRASPMHSLDKKQCNSKSPEEASITISFQILPRRKYRIYIIKMNPRAEKKVFFQFKLPRRAAIENISLWRGWLVAWQRLDFIFLFDTWPLIEIGFPS